MGVHRNRYLCQHISVFIQYLFQRIDQDWDFNISFEVQIWLYRPNSFPMSVLTWVGMMSTFMLTYRSDQVLYKSSWNNEEVTYNFLIISKWLAQKLTLRYIIYSGDGKVLNNISPIGQLFMEQFSISRAFNRKNHDFHMLSIIFKKFSNFQSA